MGSSAFGGYLLCGEYVVASIGRFAYPWLRIVAFTIHLFRNPVKLVRVLVVSVNASYLKRLLELLLFFLRFLLVDATVSLFPPSSTSLHVRGMNLF